jgi:XapX domain-containing protein
MSGTPSVYCQLAARGSERKSALKLRRDKSCLANEASLVQQAMPIGPLYYGQRSSQGLMQRRDSPTTGLHVKSVLRTGDGLRRRAMKFMIGMAISFAVGVVCGYFDIPAGSPDVIPGAFLVLAMTTGYSWTNRILDARNKPATTAHLCGGPTGASVANERAISQRTDR